MAWRELWIIGFRDLMRNRRRSALSLIAVALGLALLMMLNGLITGTMEQSLQNNIRLNTGHVQIRKDGYEVEKLSLKWSDLIEEPEALLAQVRTLPEVKEAAPVLWMNAFLNTADDSVGVQVYGIDVTSPIHQPFRDAMVAGDFPAPDDRSGILLGRRLADELKLGIGDDLSLTAVNADGEPVEAIFTVRGLFSTGLPYYDQVAVFLPLSKAQALAGTGDRVSSIVIMLHDQGDAERVAERLRSPGLVPLTWRDLNAIWLTAVESGMVFYYILDAIVMAIVAVIIANTLLMAVFERVREIGILAALGMRARQIRLMFLLEAAILGLAGIVVGFVLGTLGVSYLANVGLDIGNAAASAAGALGLGTKMYAEFVPGLFVTLAAATLGVILLASLYPAWFASRLEPVDALHSL
ncbi:MAG: ABC transporter permease [Anaerolineae bacterium]